MSDTGIVRHIDELGRIVIPMEIRRTLGIGPKDPIAISLEGDRIVLMRHQDACVLCGSSDQVTRYNKRGICATCIAGVSKL